MKINSRHFRVRPGEKIALGERPTVVKPFFKSKKQYRKLPEEHVEELSSLHPAGTTTPVIFGTDDNGNIYLIEFAREGSPAGWILNWKSFYHETIPFP